MGRLSTRPSSRAWVSVSIQCRSSKTRQQRLHLAFAQQQPLEGLQGALPALGGSGLPGGVLHRHVQQGQDRGEGRCRVSSSVRSLPVTLLADGRRRHGSRCDIGLEQVHHREIGGGLAVGHRAALQLQPALHTMGVEELVEQTGLAHPGSPMTATTCPGQSGPLQGLREPSSSGSRPTKRVSPGRGGLQARRPVPPR